MQILQATTMDKCLGQSSKRFLSTFLVTFLAFSVVLFVTSIYRNQTIVLFEGFSKANNNKALQNQNVTTTTTNDLLPLGRRREQNMTNDDNFGKEREYNNSVSEVLKGETQNVTATVEGRTAEAESKSASFTTTSSTNDSSMTQTLNNLDEKLLDGLLASGFDESSCISRFQSHQLRKPSPHKPSPYLISKLRNYEQLHRRCGPKTRPYIRTMLKISQSKNHFIADASLCKYLVWKPVNGLGNQMISIVATFLYSILTNRVLLVRFGKDKHGLFCEPFLNSIWTLPKNSPFWDNEKHDVAVETYEKMLEKNSSYEDFSSVPCVLFLNLQHTQDDPEKFFHCDHNQELLQKVNLVILQSDQYFVPSLFMTPSFNTEITKMFPEKDTIFHHLGRYLFHPSNEAWGKIIRFYQSYMEKSDEKIGLQIRVFSPVSTPHEAIMDLVLNCTIGNQILPELDMKNSVALLSSAKKKRTSLSKSVTVASLYPNYAENLRAMYLNRTSVNGEEVIGVFQPSHDGKQKYSDNLQNMKAWMEMYLLSLCDVLVTTSLSTFGYVAQGLGGLKPWQLYKLVSNETHFPSCERDFSIEPCYHSPPKLQCNGKNIENFVSSSLYVKNCRDFCFGVKMFSNGSS